MQSILLNSTLEFWIKITLYNALVNVLYYSVIKKPLYNMYSVAPGISIESLSYVHKKD